MLELKFSLVGYSCSCLGLPFTLHIFSAAGLFPAISLDFSVPGPPMPEFSLQCPSPIGSLCIEVGGYELTLTILYPHSAVVSTEEHGVEELNHCSSPTTCSAWYSHQKGLLKELHPTEKVSVEAQLRAC